MGDGALLASVLATPRSHETARATGARALSPKTARTTKIWAPWEILTLGPAPT